MSTVASPLFLDRFDDVGGVVADLDMVVVGGIDCRICRLINKLVNRPLSHKVSLILIYRTQAMRFDRSRQRTKNESTKGCFQYSGCV